MISNKHLVIYSLNLLLFLLVTSCSKEESHKDLEKPVIETNSDAVPQNCQVFYKGEEIPFRYTFTDNEGLGSYNIEIHNNFDHHTHSTDAGDCSLDEKKKPVQPWVYNKDFFIQENSLRYNAQVNIPIPANIDSGDYHFMVRVTDKSGWQELKAVSIKILDKKD
ncbi:MAG: DUF4625 domain-containing protein [Phocaeicola sp.]|uniref:DUF4625 domain-containing protein n=1 Tax=Phocaeicola TaxID=909656 RepID=UPI00234FAAB0|nr:DUF4625 domain-containing protein [Phocaeicola oris]MCE2615797.1 DUF4625 domain-containing protein [Phocaeicola oris]